MGLLAKSSRRKTSHWLQGKCERISLSKAASGMILQNYRRLTVCIFSFTAGSWSSKRVIGRFFKISNFKGASKNFEFIFLQLRNKNGKNHQCMYRKHLFIIISLQNIFISWHKPFNPPTSLRAEQLQPSIWVYGTKDLVRLRWKSKDLKGLGHEIEFWCTVTHCVT
jgi:hypothetical protein